MNPLIENVEEENIVYEEYFNGFYGNISKEDTKIRQQTINNFENKMKTQQNWTNRYPPMWFGAHDCSEMMISVGERFNKFKIFVIVLKIIFNINLECFFCGGVVCF